MNRKAILFALLFPLATLLSSLLPAIPFLQIAIMSLIWIVSGRKYWMATYLVFTLPYSWYLFSYYFSTVPTLIVEPMVSLLLFTVDIVTLHLGLFSFVMCLQWLMKRFFVKRLESIRAM